MNFKKYHVSRNLFDSTILQNNKGVSSNGNIIDQSGRIATVTPINVSGYSAVTLTYAGDNVSFIYATFNSGTLVERVAGKESGYTINTTNCDLLYICFYGSSAITKDDVSNIMLNLGSEALPYEPYSSEVWHDTPHYIHNTSTDTLTTLPAVLYPNGTTATVGLKGQTLQSSAPSPTSPIMPQGTGERTGNLFDKATVIIGKRVVANGESINENMAHSDYIDLSGINAISVSSGISIDSTNIYFYSSKTNAADSYVSGRTASVPQGAKYCRLNMYVNDIDTFMLNTGTEALPYEPYGVKIPISSAGQTTPIYLGEVETTRKIKKLVLTGEETSIRKNTTSTNDYLYYIVNGPNASDVICTHLPYKISIPTGETIGICARQSARVTYMNFGAGIMEAQSSGNTIAGFKEYLAAQYAAGTPVTVWYVLATEKTGIVNEPLMKIGDYADTVNGITVPTITGKDTFDVETTLKPSKASLSYTGWHDATVKEWDGSDWQ